MSNPRWSIEEIVRRRVPRLAVADRPRHLARAPALRHRTPGRRGSGRGRLALSRTRLRRHGKARGASHPACAFGKIRCAADDCAREGVVQWGAAVLAAAHVLRPRVRKNPRQEERRLRRTSEGGRLVSVLQRTVRPGRNAGCIGPVAPNRTRQAFARPSPGTVTRTRRLSPVSVRFQAPKKDRRTPPLRAGRTRFPATRSR